MKTFTLKNKFQTNATLVAKRLYRSLYGAGKTAKFVKSISVPFKDIWINAGSSLTVSAVADCLNNTEK